MNLYLDSMQWIYFFEQNPLFYPQDPRAQHRRVPLTAGAVASPPPPNPPMGRRFLSRVNPGKLASISRSIPSTREITSYSILRFQIVSSSFVRVSLLVSLAVALCGSQVLAAQSPGNIGLVAERTENTLPNAPSASLVSQVPSQSSSGAVSSSQPQQASTQSTTQTTTPPQNETPEQRKARIKAEAQVQVVKEEHQRTAGILPAFNTVIAGVSPPLTPGQKWDLVYHTAKDPYTFGLAFVVTGLGEARDNTNYGWGPDGYFKDVGASYLDNVDGAVIGNALLPIILHQDPRYFRMGMGHPVSRRIINAALSTIMCKGDNGKTQFNASNVAGNFIAGAISNAYYPASSRGVGLTIDNGLVVTAEGALGAQLLEFGPDLNAFLSRQRQRKLAKQAAKQAAANATTPVPAPTPK
jgi:hypothetical protein